ncbi:hypothetical protein SAMN05216368_10713 [Cryobacterium flavum]|uniref:Phospholipase n=2 Tax=Cryobacterium flavum TaxID=1424659 RepID=A0A5E9G1D6_9MICO|nr:hypothetical protein SAMN05216368_10713 [Cryobacterium flavum]
MKDMRPKHTETPHAHLAPRTQHKPRKPRTRRHEIFVATGAALVIAGLVASSGFVAQSADARQDSIAATTVLAESTGLQSDQLDYYAAHGESISRDNASAALSAANVVIAASQSKVDATTLTSVASSLASYAIMPIDQVESLTAEAKVETASVAAATAEVDRVAAEVAAAAAAAAAAAGAAAQAAAEAARVQSVAGGNTVDGARATAQSMAASQYGWGADQFSCLDRLWQKESGWNYAAMNSSSGATGIPQAVPGSKMASAGNDWATNATTQIAWGLGYIKASSYGTPCAAWSHSQAVGWY